MSAKIPNIPKELYQPRFLHTLLLFGYALSLFLGFGAVSAGILASDWSLVLKIPLVLLSSLISGQGLHLLGNMGHEGFHFTLHENRDVSIKIGIFSSAATLFHHEVGFSYSHWNHHHFTNTAKDPDTQIFTRFKNALVRILFARVEAVRIYAADNLRLALNRPLDYKVAFPIPLERIRFYARLNYAALLCWILVYGLIIWMAPFYGMVLLGGALLASNAISGLRPYFEHAGLGFQRLERTRTYTHPFWTFFCGNINYHLEHHLFPTVPFFNLPKVHALLKQHGVYEDTNQRVIEGGLLAPLNLALHAAYPDPKSDASA